ncbi:APC family permease [Prochlorothrix hollandica]|uniref:APC family permease n=1 Tax=Prochlorothrix hollandica TaxID=1223 RepID=UPI00333FC30B
MLTIAPIALEDRTDRPGRSHRSPWKIAPIAIEVRKGDLPLTPPFTPTTPTMDNYPPSPPSEPLGSGEEEPGEQFPTLKRDLSLWAVICLGINAVIGQGIFLLPGKAASLMGPAALLALALGGILCFGIALCFAEVGSRFQSTGGAYVYARETFGDFVGFAVGWMTCWVAVLSWAALSKGFTNVLAYFLPVVGQGWTQMLCAAALVALLTAVNLRGVGTGATVVKVFTLAKLLPIGIFIGFGLFALEPSHFVPFAPQGIAPSLADTTLLLLYAYVGFETLVVPAGEIHNPQRSLPLALLITLALCGAVYMGVYGVAVGTYGELAGSANPVAEASSRFLGPGGAVLVAMGIVCSVAGTNAGAALVSPRRFFAMAEQGHLPRILGAIDPQTRVPHIAIVLTGVLTLVLTVSGTFEQLLVVGVLARFAQYIPTAIAVLVLRRRSQGDRACSPATYRIPGGPLVPLLTLVLCG